MRFKMAFKVVSHAVRPSSHSSKCGRFASAIHPGFEALLEDTAPRTGARSGGIVRSRSKRLATAESVAGGKWIEAVRTPHVLADFRSDAARNSSASWSSVEGSLGIKRRSMAREEYELRQAA